MIKTQAAVSGAGIIYHSRIGEGRFEVVTGINFKEGMLDAIEVKPKKEPVDTLRIDLHKKLDEWLDDELGLNDVA